MIAALGYLNDKMDAQSHQVGRALFPGATSEFAARGAAILSRLRLLKFVSRSPYGWRITSSGRDFLNGV